MHAAFNAAIGRPASQALAPLAQGHGKLATAISAWSFGQQTWQQVQAWRARRRAEREYTILVGERDLIYADLHEWLLARVPAREQRSLVARTVYDLSWNSEGMPNGYEHPPRIRYYYGGRRSLDFVLDGHRVSVSMDRPDEDPEQERGKMSRLSEEKIVLSVHSLEGQQAVMRLLEALAIKQRKPSTPRVLVANKWGDWVQAKTLSSRDPSTVVLAAGQMERLSGRLERFLASEQQYARVGLPYHLGILLSGPPGTGKSSAAMALALAHKLDVYYLPLSDVDSDTDLIQLFTRIPDRTVLLLEDVDVVYSAQDRDRAEESVTKLRTSAAGLLNVLDGVVTPHGLIVVMTTNKKDRLDPALIRPGRVDLDEEVGHLTDEQLARLVSTLTGISGPLPFLDGRLLAASEITGLISRHVDDMPAARAAVVDYLNRAHTESAA